jgi:SET domain-containing protein
MLQEILHSINVYGKTKLAPSRVCDGVGVFAITEIPKDYIMFQDVISDEIFIPYDKINDVRIIQHLKSTCNSDSFGIYLSRTYNNINMAYYINHSETPNVYHDLTIDRYVTIKEIQPGEELTCLYTKKEIDWLT